MVGMFLIWCSEKVALYFVNQNFKTATIIEQHFNRGPIRKNIFENFILWKQLNYFKVKSVGLFFGCLFFVVVVSTEIQDIRCHFSTQSFNIGQFFFGTRKWINSKLLIIGSLVPYKIYLCRLEIQDGNHRSTNLT